MTKEQLRNYRKIKNEYRQLEQRLRALESHPESEDVILQPLREFYTSKLAELVQAQLAIEYAIEALKPVERELIRFHYFDGLPWHQVAVRISYSEPQTHRIHSRALRKLRNL